MNVSSALSTLFVRLLCQKPLVMILSNMSHSDDEGTLFASFNYWHVLQRLSSLWLDMSNQVCSTREVSSEAVVSMFS